MDIIGIICEYNPFHHGHAYHIEKVKEIYPNSLIILVLNGYFLQRGEASILTKEKKVAIALNEKVDIVIEHPFVFGSNSADIFAESAITLLNHLKIDKLIFGSEGNDLKLLTKMAKTQLENDFQAKIKFHLANGINYPTALNKAIGIPLDKPNDLLGIAYIKAILKNNFSITPITIQRTNDHHDNISNERVVSGSNIREKLRNNINIHKFTNYADQVNIINEDLLFNLIKSKIITDNDLSKYLTVDEGLEHKLKKEIIHASNTQDLINRIKSKRYTYNRLNRMLTHILIGLTKEDKLKLKTPEYIKLLGFNNRGKEYINQIRKTLEIPLKRKITDNYLAQKYELKAALIYDIITNGNAIDFELTNKPIYFE